MITLKDAIDIVQERNKGLYPSTCLDMGDFLLFVMDIPLSGDSEILTGTHFPIVYKYDGEYEEYDITSDPEAYLNAKTIF